eukprot:TRINITY_DN10648_c0_g2_i4.p1 TRINITY_DN10648_c0_g2~~TRINITY_DN10648_c0_g2_i4.p1  ORF type:complete len:261 (-),score=37.50 TRINITY_DN10648_c0_g2_i4:43-825(-)
MVNAALATVVGLMTTFLAREKPPSPPSASAADVADTFVEGLKQIIHNPPYLIVMFTFGIGLGVFNIMTSLLAQLVEPAGIGHDDAALLGLILIGVGLLTAGIVAPILDYTHRYKEIYVIAFFLCSASGLYLCFTLFSSHRPTFGLLTGGLVLLGVGAFMILPTALELSVETTHPVAPVTSAGFLWMMGQIWGIIFLQISDFLLVKPGGTKIIMWMLTSFILLGTVLSCLLIHPLKTRYKRLEVEANGESQRIFPSSVQRY